MVFIQTLWVLVNDVFKRRLNCTFRPYLLLIVRFCTPSFFLSDFAPHLLPIVFCSKSSLKEGKGAKDGVQNRSKKKKRGCKIAQLAKR